MLTPSAHCVIANARWLLAALLVLPACATGPQLRWQPTLVLASNAGGMTAPRIPAHPISTAPCSDVPAPRSGDAGAVESSGDHEPAAVASEPEPADDGQGATFTSEEDE